jgi:hypothetical protein
MARAGPAPPVRPARAHLAAIAVAGVLSLGNSIRGVLRLRKAITGVLRLGKAVADVSGFG